MANNAALRANFDNFLYDMQGQLQRLFARDNVLLAECSGVVQASPSNPVIDYDANYGRYTRAMDGNREHFEGEQVRVPVLTAALQGAGGITENSTWNVPIPLDTQKAHREAGAGARAVRGLARARARLQERQPVRDVRGAAVHGGGVRCPRRDRGSDAQPQR
jgi:hypothetical protein